MALQHAAAAVGDNSRGRAVVMADAGHKVSVDQPDAFNSTLLEFVEGSARE